ncbi:hypothetical protein DFH09DRAFT_1444726 [Mycena vulgaris]|nr:hypothetical protein DFH09DRAFT_1444726 [Mycena vulgaris]
MASLVCRLSVALWLVGLVGAQTLYDVVPTQPPTAVASASFVIAAVGVGADGATTYVEKGTESYLAFEYSDVGGTFTKTLLSTPTAFTRTFVEDASGYRGSVSMTNGIFVETCAFGADGHAACVQAIPLGSLGTETVTVSGSVAPFYTLTSAASVSVALTTKNTGTDKRTT